MSQNEVSFFALQSDILGAKKDTSPWDIPKLNSGQQSADIHSIYNIYPWDIQLMIGREQVETPFSTVQQSGNTPDNLQSSEIHHLR